MKLFLLFPCCFLLSMCADYQSHVAARTVGVSGQYDKTTGNVSGGFSDRVEYR